MRLKKVATLLGAGVVMAGAAAGSTAALPLGTTQVSTAKATAAGQPTPTSTLLCGTFLNGSDRFSGSSNIDHPSGATASGTAYSYTQGETCENPTGANQGSFSWTIGHSNVNTATEFGTEHGTAMLQNTSTFLNGFNGRVTNYDLSPADPAGDGCAASNWTIYYASGHQFDPGSCSPSAPGNFNTRGGAATGNHFNGKYQTIVYQDNNNSSASGSCQSGSSNYCFEGIIVGKQN